MVPRQTLLIEIERRCSHQGCGVRNQIGLTKEEARTFNGFKCERCERWADDALTERDVPEWWEELQLTSFAAELPDTTGGAQREAEIISPHDSEVIRRLSDAYRRTSGMKNEDAR